MALSNHLAAHRKEWKRAETEPLGAKQGRYHDVPTGPEATVGLQNDSVSHALCDQRLVSLRQS